MSAETSEESLGPAWLLPREGWVLVGLGLVAVLLFFVTSSVVARTRRHQVELGREWSERGEAALETGQAEAALEAFRTAIVYDRENREYQLRLARALLAAGRSERAETYLLAIREREPGSGPVNLELARMEAARGRATAAALYYRAALVGDWPDDPIARRLATRFELAELLVRARASSEALAELIALSSRLPREDGAARTRLGRLLLAAGERDRALAEFRAVLRREPQSVAALLGAGQAAFDSRAWSRAVFYLRAAERAGGGKEAAERLATAEAVLAADPFQPRLGSAERARRAAHGLKVAAGHLESCRPGEAPELEALRARFASIDLSRAGRDLRRDPDRIEAAMDLVFEAERATAARCPRPSGPERTFLFLAPEAEATR